MAEIRTDEKGIPIKPKHYVTDLENFPKVWNKIVHVDVPIEINAFRKWVALSIYERIIKRSPVDRGFYRASHNVSVVSKSTAKPKKPSSQRQGSEASGAEKVAFHGGIARLADIDLKSSIWVTSNLPYSEVIENGGFPTPVKKGSYIRRGRPGGPGHVIRSAGGFSRQAPMGVYRISIQEVISQIQSRGMVT